MYTRPDRLATVLLIGHFPPIRDTPSHDLISRMLTKDYPDHHDAELVIKLYDLRREPVMRDARAQVNGKFWPRTFDDVLAVTKGDHPLNTPFRQATTYWEMVYSMAKHGVIHADFLMETAGEGMFVYAKLEPYIAQYREHVNPFAFRNAEWMATNSAAARQVLELFRKRVAAALAAQA